MKSKYFIRALTTNDVLDIAEEKFLFLKKLKSRLSEAFAIEEKYEIIISNYLDLERESIGVSVTNMISDKHDHIDFFDTILALNKRMVNLLTSIRLYNDQLGSHVATCTGNDESREKIKSAQSAEYDNNLYYRFMEALRNHVQHFGAPVHRVSFGSGWDESRENIKFHLDFVAQKKNLKINRKFKKPILEEIGDEVNLLHAIRSYIESISSIHVFARAIMNDDVDASRHEIEEQIVEYENKYGSASHTLMVYKVSENDIEEELLLSLYWDDIRQKIQRKNKQLVNLSKRYVSGEAHNNTAQPGSS